ncbi:MAG TPA: aminopeptidase, partial [Eubacterium sp.]|nr:aminopeptidase [Eubacterium sp.]
MKKGISLKKLESFEKDFDSNIANKIAMNAVTNNGINQAALNRDVYNNNQNAFSIEVKAGDVCNQKQSGRCWMFAALNTFRLQVMDKLNIENMELSQNYPLFYDKLEKSNLFLENMIETIDMPVTSREVAFLLMAPLGDGGQWDMFRSLVAKYGVVPKDVMPETEVSSMTREMDKYLTTKLREYACEFRKMKAEGKTVKDLRDAKEEMLNTIYRMLCISL